MSASRRASMLAGLAGFWPFGRRRTPGRFHGRVEGLRDGVLVGWARDGAAPDGRTVVTVETDRGRVLEVPADLMREDVRAAGFGDGHHGFRVPLARLGQDATSLQVWFGDRTEPMPGSPVRLARAGNAAVDAPAPSRPIDLGRWQGGLDMIARGHVTGWLVDTHEPGRRPVVVVRSGAHVLAHDRACRWRDQPVGVAAVDELCGFSLRFTPPAAPASKGEPLVLSVEGAKADGVQLVALS